MFLSKKIHCLSTEARQWVSHLRPFLFQGDVDAQVSRVSHESRIHVEDGDVHLKLNENYPLKIDILANEVVPDAKFQVGLFCFTPFNLLLN